ncbi:hypothetical protein NDR87_15435 [Nocardia sp. CDC159]|uniref:Secreted protein n=1 Tax=Nocardia pulmonis TaxID=2951408 RepID=A0A9X2E9V0_9NOCA|nr:MULTISPECIES: hypothetical protein [Nocardia]MCM6775515.1 hypothetical protein [Nocardia pulmonis]MCM6787751.1 hypothetical protein [Nocardia sp. CDC159]
MKRIAVGVTGVGIAVAAVAAAGSATAAPPEGVYCAAGMCFNSTSKTQTVTGVAVCPTAQLPVTWTIEPMTAASMTMVCPTGVAPQTVEF